MAMALNHREEQLVHLISKTVSATDLGGALALPVSLTGRVWPERVPNKDRGRVLTVLDINGTPCPFVCRLRRTKGGNPQPEVFGPGWKAFIREKQIKVGEELAFFLPPNLPLNHHFSPPVFLITVKRTIRLGGAFITAYV